MRFCRNSLKFRWPPLVKSSRYRKGKCDFVEIHWENFISRHTYLFDLFFRKWIMRRSSLSTAVVCWINKEREYMGRGSAAVNRVKRFKTMEIRGVNGVLKGFPRIKLSKSDEFDRLGLTFSRWNSSDPSGLLFISSRYRKGKCDFVEIHWNSDNLRWSDWEPLIWWWLLNWTVDDDCVTRTTKTCLMSVLALIKLGLDLFRKNINRKRHKPRSKSHISVRNEEVIALNFWPKNGSRSFLDLRFRILAFAATNVWMREGP